MDFQNQPQSGSLTEKVVAHISAQIDGGALEPGAKLQSEAEIVRDQGVSRTVVREAISRLQAMGLIVTRHGIGSFVCEPVAKGSFGFERNGLSAAQEKLAILELRIGLETEAAALAATRRTDADLEAMQRALADFSEQIKTAGDGIDPDFRFHLAIARAAHNSYFFDILSSLGSGAIPRSRCRIDELEMEPREYLKRVANEHEDIYSAILRGDSDASRAAVRNHLGNGRERMRRATEQLVAVGAKNQ
ncbi:MAG TPA: FadR/GntR family transcriptional regulator [Terracidiphilus sp.]|nr:FadR/GntR family transcriptional regulator [Terracidiphilus sp.]